MYMNSNISEKKSNENIMSNVYQKALSFVYPEFQKSLESIHCKRKSLSTVPCLSTGSTRIKPIECDQTINSLLDIMNSTEKVTTLLKNIDGQTALLLGSRNYNLLLKMYIAKEKTTRLIRVTKMLRMMSSKDSPERTKACLQAHCEYLSFYNELEEIEKEMELLLDALMFGLAKNKNAPDALAIRIVLA